MLYQLSHSGGVFTAEPIQHKGLGKNTSVLEA